MKRCISEKDYNRFFEDSMTADEIAYLDSHAKECDACRIEYGKWKALKQAIADAGETVVPETLKSRVMEGISGAVVYDLPQEPQLKRTAAVCALAALLLAYYFVPSFGDFIPSLLRGAISWVSELIYNFISLAGIDIKSVVSFFKALVPVASRLIWFFAFSTLMLVVGFFSLILKGRAKLKAN